MKNFIITLLFFCLAKIAHAQNTQTIRGTITDGQSKSPLPGVTVIIAGTNPIIGTVTDAEGIFKLEAVPVGRITIQASYVGYEPVSIPNLELNSAKELILDIPLNEQVTKLDEVVVSASGEKDRTKNEMVTVSSRTLSMVEAVKYSGTRSDPSRMAQNFAGVSGASDDRNDIIIRGNSPTGVLWRLEGIDIPNPNHFGTLGTTGGPVTILNTNNLKNSDFLTSAWSAEYGNATSGVFDLQMKNGNNKKHEFLGQVGFNGFELGAEGPFSRKSPASYIINYRYSTLGLLSAIGVNFGTGAAIPQYQDLTFKINVPTEKAGKFTLFGLGGLSYIEFLDSESEEDDFYSGDGTDSYVRSDKGIVGLTHTYFFNNNTSGKLILAGSIWKNSYDEDSLSTLDGSPLRTDVVRNDQVKYTIGYSINKKFNAKNTLSAGFTNDIYQLKLNQQILGGDYRLINLTYYKGIAPLLQTYVQWQHRFNDAVTLNTGIHHQHFFFNNTWMVEPRANIRYQFKPKHALSFGTGLYSQMQPLQVYFYEAQQADGSTVRSNEDLDLLRSVHLVAGYDYRINNNMRLKAEVYGQYLSNAGVESIPSSFSLLNSGADFVIPEKQFLVNNGKGYNYGLELTLEKFFSKGYYFLVTASLFQSQYQGSDKVWRSTAFNSNYVFNVLGGKEFRIKNKHIISLDTKVAISGGQRYSPIDYATSDLVGQEVRYDSRAFSEQYKAYVRWDVKLGYTFEGKRTTQKFYVDLQNVTFQQNIFSQTYNTRTRETETTYQIGFFPDVQYRILF